MSVWSKSVPAIFTCTFIESSFPSLEKLALYLPAGNKLSINFSWNIARKRIYFCNHLRAIFSIPTLLLHAIEMLGVTCPSHDVI